jgi:uncharacterized protein (TIGR03084 family)
MDRVLEALAAEHEQLHGLVESMTPDQWAAPTRCEGWDVSDVLIHLAQTDEMAIGSATGRYDEVLARLASGIDGISSIDAGVAAMVARGKAAAGSHAELVERWWSNAQNLVEVLDSIDLSSRVMWVTGELSARSMATTRLAETWIHAGDIAEAVGVALPYTDRLFDIVRLAWRTLPYAFSTAGEPMTGPVAFRLTSPSGGEWNFEPDEPALTTISGSAAELCDVASRRVDASGTSLRGDGPDAETVLRLVRTYA